LAAVIKAAVIKAAAIKAAAINRTNQLPDYPITRLPDSYVR
jgi:hypothetical protein